METWLMQSQSLCIVLLMVAGIFFRRRRELHVKIMSAAMIWDVLLILQIELSRSAILNSHPLWIYGTFRKKDAGPGLQAKEPPSPDGLVYLHHADFNFRYQFLGRGP